MRAREYEKCHVNTCRWHGCLGARTPARYTYENTYMGVTFRGSMYTDLMTSGKWACIYTAVAIPESM
eukprot:1392044-Amorphochlora_amoeboformis.AAC.2